MGRGLALAPPPIAKPARTWRMPPPGGPETVTRRGVGSDLCGKLESRNLAYVPGKSGNPRQIRGPKAFSPWMCRHPVPTEALRKAMQALDDPGRRDWLLTSLGAAVADRVARPEQLSLMAAGGGPPSGVRGNGWGRRSGVIPVGEPRYHALRGFGVDW